MTRLRRLSILSWLGFFVAPATWVAQHGIGQGAADTSCSVAGIHWGVSNTAYQVGLLIGASLLILLAEAAALVVVRATSDASYESPPPVGRIRLVAIAAAATNLIFLVIVLLDGIASIVLHTCANS